MFAPITRKCPANAAPAKPVKKAEEEKTKSWYLNLLIPLATAHSGLSLNAWNAIPIGLLIT